MVLGAFLIEQHCKLFQMIEPFCDRMSQNGMSYGLSVAGYDIRCKQAMRLYPGEFWLASSVERFMMPKDIIAEVKDKSTWARKGLSVFNTVIEPGWHGFLTLELKNQGNQDLYIHEGDPIAQIIFSYVTGPEHALIGYTGKYQDQLDAPQPAILRD